MPLTIPAMPDTGSVPASTPEQGQGWVDGARAGVEAGAECDSPNALVTRGLVDVWKDAHERLLAQLRLARQKAHEQSMADHRESLEKQAAAYERGREHEVSLAEIRAESAKFCASRRLPIEYVRGPAGEGYVYVIAFTTGTVKVGQTEDPKQRLNTHQGEALAYGVGAIGYWVSPPHLNFKTNEADLIRLCFEVSRRSRREYFHEIGFEQAVDLAWTLTFDSAIPDQPAIGCGLS